MRTKTYTVRVPESAPEITSEQAAAWLDSQIASNTPFSPDPGAGDGTLRLSLEKEKVEQAARAAGEPEAVLLRRLIATHTGLQSEEKKQEVEEPKPQPIVLKGGLRLRPEQVKPVVLGFERLQSFAITRAMRCPEAATVTKYTEEEREQLSAGLCECANRRASPWLVQNIDWIGLVLNVASIEFEKIDRARAVAQRIRAARPKTITVRPESTAPSAPAPSASAPPRAPARANPLATERPEGESLDDLPDAMNLENPIA